VSRNKSIKSFSAGRVRAAVWRNEEQRDRHTVLRFSVRVQKQKDREYPDTGHYCENDLADLELVIRKAREFIRLRESEARTKIGSLLEDAGSGVAEGDQAQKPSHIQKVVNELRDAITTSDEFEADHKRRVLSKFEKLQSELHKEVSGFSHLLGRLIKASAAAREIGGNIKTIAGWMREIVSIAVLIQTLTFGLRSGIPFRLPGQIGSSTVAPIAARGKRTPETGDRDERDPVPRWRPESDKLPQHGRFGRGSVDRRNKRASLVVVFPLRPFASSAVECNSVEERWAEPTLLLRPL
jgi:hypothetical protein